MVSSLYYPGLCRTRRRKGGGTDEDTCMCIRKTLMYVLCIRITLVAQSFEKVISHFSRSVTFSPACYNPQPLVTIYTPFTRRNRHPHTRGGSPPSVHSLSSDLPSIHFEVSYNDCTHNSHVTLRSSFRLFCQSRRSERFPATPIHTHTPAESK